MVYNLADNLDRVRAEERVQYLISKGAVIELTEKAIKTPNQNRYAHLLMGIVAMELGETLEYVKLEYFKRHCNREIFVVTRQDKFVGEVETIRSFTDLSKEETSRAIDRFKRWGAEQGWYMPSPEDESILRSLEIEMARHRQYL